jgi:uncharacterized protein YndB with AHSA1/START domain
MPRYTARRTLPAPVERVWAVLEEPAQLAEWWPGIARTEPTVRRALAPGAHWNVEGSHRPSILHRPELNGELLVLEVLRPRRLVFQLSGERMDVELDLQPVEDGETQATLVVGAPRFHGIRRTFPSQALSRLASLVRPAAD